METQTSHQQSSSPVLVVGAGPVGCVLALELAHHGVPSILIERSVGPPRHPKMDYVNARTMELFRRLGLSESVRAGGVGAQHSFNFIWTRDFDEPPIAVWPYASVAEAWSRIEQVNDGTVPIEPYQRVLGMTLEVILREQVAANPLIDLRRGWAFESLDQDDTAVVATVTDTTTDAMHEIRSLWIAACDGANSRVRDSLGIGVDLAAPKTQHCDVYFKSTDPVLRRHGRAFLTIAAGGLTLVSRDEKDTWTGTFMLPPDGTPVGDPVEAMYRMLGVRFQIDEVVNVTEWEGALAVAKSYRQGRSFIIGDAAHQFYPTGGHGANTGVADAVDLGWKLAAAIQGWGGPALLDSYELERRPIALFNREMCANLLEVWIRFAHLVRNGTSREQLAGWLAQETHQLDNVGIHFGYRYSGSPVVVAEDGTPPPWDWSRISPEPWPGGRAPVVRLEDSTPIFDRFGTGFTLVELSGDDAGAGLEAAAADAGVPLTRLALDDEGVREVWGRRLVLVRPDQHVAWRGDSAPDDPRAVLDVIRGDAGAQGAQGEQRALAAVR